jgi:N-formylglutamate deformylase
MMFSTTHPVFRFREGDTPLLLSIPHSGTYVPPAVATQLTPEARALPDTDFHLDELYRFALNLGASFIMATHSRYVIDVNRPPDGPNVRQGERVTGVCPVETFDGYPIHEPGGYPDIDEIDARREAIWRPYHAQLAQEMQRIHQRHGVAVLWDAHSLRSQLPRYFEGSLPDINIGTHKGASCDGALSSELFRIASEAEGFTASLNGRFTGGYITRQYGRPAENMHALQCEITHRAYMDEHAPYRYRPDRASRIRPHLHRMMEAAMAFARARARHA